jgi:hypothetical protein
VEQIESSRKSPVDEERKTKLTTVDFFRPFLPPSEVVKKNKHESKVVKKEVPKSTSSCNKERGVKHKKYVEDDDEFADEIKVTGSRESVEVYQKDFDGNPTDDAGHKSLEKEGDCTVIQKANAALMVSFGKPKVGMGNLQNVYSKEKSDDSITTPSFLNVLTSYTR